MCLRVGLKDMFFFSLKGIVLSVSVWKAQMEANSIYTITLQILRAENSHLFPVLDFPVSGFVKKSHCPVLNGSYILQETFFRRGGAGEKGGERVGNMLCIYVLSILFSQATNSLFYFSPFKVIVSTRHTDASVLGISSAEFPKLAISFLQMPLLGSE